MNKILTIVFFLAFIKIFSQNNSDKGIISVMNKNAEQILKNSKAYSVSIAVVKNGKTYTKHFGEIDKEKNNTANENTYFEIASISKLITGQLLAKAVLDKKINLEDDIRKYLKGDYPNLEYKGNFIKIKDLISYESALPRSLPDESEITKIMNDNTAFKLEKLNKDYSKKLFFQDLKKIRLDTIPGKVYNYSNLSLELTGLILENAYHKNFETLVRKNLFAKLKMNHTKLDLSKNEKLANGYNPNHILMPHFSNNLWGSSGKFKSTLGDLAKFLKYQLDSTNKVVHEAQRNIKNSDEQWYGYFWDEILVIEKGKYAFKHGGAYGTQTLFGIYPEQNLGVCIIVNISGEETYSVLQNSISKIAEDLISDQNPQKIYGYRLTTDKVIFSYQHQKKLDAKLINKVSVAGSFNDWNPKNSEYQMINKGNGLYELEIPKENFEKGKDYSFKFVINNIGWLEPPKNALNKDKTPDNNLTLKIE